MAHDYTRLDAAIISRVGEGVVSFAALSAAMAEHSDALAKSDPAPAWQIVARRLQSLRRAGRIRHQRKPNQGWVLGSLSTTRKRPSGSLG